MRRFLFFILTVLFAGNIIAQETPKQDTLVIGGVTIIRDSEAPIESHTPRKSFLKKLSSRTNPKRIKTQWASVDVGVSSYIDRTDYTITDAQNYAPSANKEWLGIKPFKSRNVNIWVVTQRVNLLDHYLNFQYGLGVELNNYHYKQSIRYVGLTPAVENAPIVFLDKTAGRTYKKDKLAADYITVPAMLNFNLTPYRLYPFEVSAGFSVGYLYSARNKFINSDEGKAKARGDFDLRPWKLSYIAELNLGIIRLYGSYAFKSMYQRGLDITPYTFGIRIKPMEAFGKIQTD